MTSWIKWKKSQPNGTCARQRLNQHVILPDGSTVLCCMDYSLKTRQSKYKFDYASAIKEHNDQFMAGKYNHFCEQCEWFIKDQSDWSLINNVCLIKIENNTKFFW